jgi:hypothetical protein
MLETSAAFLFIPQKRLSRKPRGSGLAVFIGLLAARFLVVRMKGSIVMGSTA